MMRDGFVLKSLDSMDTRTADFFGHGVRIRKYVFKLVAPKKTGSFSVGPLSWKVNDKEYELADRIPVEIKKSFDDNALSISLTPSKKTIYEGEQFSVLLSMRTYEHFEGNVSFTGTELGDDFIAHRSDLKDLKLQPVPGSRTDMETSARFAWLAPMKSGSLTIPPIQVKYTKRGAPKVVDDYFIRTQYKGKIYKTNNMLGKTLAQYCPNDSAMAKEQKRIEAELAAFEKNVWGDQAKKDSLDSIANAANAVKGKAKVKNRRAGGSSSVRASKSASVKTRRPKSSSSSNGSARVTVRRERH